MLFLWDFWRGMEFHEIWYSNFTIKFLCNYWIYKGECNICEFEIDHMNDLEMECRIEKLSV